jgi:microcompartment protein CcmK/EutM
MRIGKVIGNVTLSRVHPSLVGARWLIAVPLSLEALHGEQASGGSQPPDQNGSEPVVVYDELGAGVGSRIGLSEGREATQPFYPERKPIDAYCACILDTIEVVDPENEPTNQPINEPRKLP